MVKKIHVEIDIKGSASGFGRSTKGLTEESKKEREELKKVFSGEDFGL